MRCRRAAVAAAAVALLVTACGGGEREGGEAPPPASEPGEELQMAVELYFPGAGGRLVVEPREITATDSAVERVRAVVSALLAGPEGDGLEPPFPEGVELAAVYLTAEGIAYIDLQAPEGAPPPASGSTEEMQRVYSLVNSVALNVPEAQRVVLLWNGVQPPSFAGHLDTTHPLAPATSLVAR